MFRRSSRSVHNTVCPERTVPLGRLTSSPPAVLKFSREKVPYKAFPLGPGLVTPLPPFRSGNPLLVDGFIPSSPSIRPAFAALRALASWCFCRDPNAPRFVVSAISSEPDHQRQPTTPSRASITNSHYSSQHSVTAFDRQK